VSQYRAILKDVFVPWCDAVGLTDPGDLTEDALERFVKHLTTQPGAKGRKLHDATVRTYGRGVNLMLAWAARQGAMSAARVLTDKPKHKPYKTLTRQEIDTLVKKANSPRDRLIIRLLADSGMRLGELLNIRLGDIKREAGSYFVTLQGKTGYRVAGIERDLFRDMMAYVNGGRKGPAGEGAALFMSERKSGGGYKPLTKSGVEQMLKHTAADAGVTKRVFPHLLRHSYATDWLNRGGSEVLLMKTLGHTSLAMIASTYANQADEDVRKAMLEHLKRTRQVAVQQDD
jgi:integrase